MFKDRSLQFVKPSENSVYTGHNPIGINYLKTWIKSLLYHIFKHGFLDAVDPLRNCITTVENTIHYLFHCSNFSSARNTFLNEIVIVDRSTFDQVEIKIIQTFVYGNPTYSVNDNKLILDVSVKCILETKRFEGPIF